MKDIYIGDDVCSFITITNPSEYVIEKVNVQVGTICKSYENPVFPIVVNLTSEETNSLKSGTNTLYVAVWTNCGKQTSSNFARFNVVSKKVQCEV